MSDTLTFAVAKGYLLSEGVKKLQQIGYEFDDDLSNSRKLFTYSKCQKIRLLQVRPWDVPEYVELGAADIGIVGQDVLWEKENPVVQLLNLNYGKCSLVLARTNENLEEPLKHNAIIATKYPNCTQKYFADRDTKIKMVKLYGAVELGPLTGLADAITDLSATGNTLRENGLGIVDTIFESSAILIANKVQYKFHHDAILELVEKLTPLC
jgi:ATP phosphoribosyltransferase